MKNMKYAVAASAAAFAMPMAAHAQGSEGASSSEGAETYIGLSVGNHNLRVAGAIFDAFQVEIDDDSPIFGAVAGVDFPLGSHAFAGVEANYHFGSSAIDNEFGGSARLGFRADNGAKFYVRGGYQQVDLDLEKVVGMDLDDVDGLEDSAGDYMVGIGTDFGVFEGAMLRVNLDSIALDTVRITTGVTFTL